MQPATPGAGNAARPPLPPAGLATLVRDGVVDAELGALIWIMLEARTPVLVVGPEAGDRNLVADALSGALPASSRLFPVAAGDEFRWLPEAATLGWSDRPSAGSSGGPTANARTDVLSARDLADPAAGGPAGDRARLVVRALSLGYGMLATMQGRSLQDVLDRLHAPDVGTDEDERSRVGMVLVMAAPGAAPGPRVEVAHYVRPVAFDTHGHVQRLPPVVLATWGAAADRWDHFAWGVLDDLAGRAQRTPRDLEREQARRAAALAG